MAQLLTWLSSRHAAGSFRPFPQLLQKHADRQAYIRLLFPLLGFELEFSLSPISKRRPRHFEVPDFMVLGHAWLVAFQQLSRALARNGAHTHH